MRKRRLALSALAVTSCSPVTTTDAGFDAGTDAGRPDAGTDAGTDAGYDAGVPDAGPADAGSTFDGGCPCFRTDGGCALPPDFPLDGGVPQFYVEAQCLCTPSPQNPRLCYDETQLRCFSWACNPGRGADGGGDFTLPDGGLVCLC
jgi:hypothetical protein